MSDPGQEQQASKPSRGVALLAWVPVVVGLPLLWWHASHYMPFVADDALISARYAERLLDGQGLTWTEGERVEGYSNLLWTLALAVLGGLGLDLIDAMRVLGSSCMAATFYALARVERPRSPVDVVGPTLAAVTLAAAGPIAVWTIGGLEQTMVAAALAWAFVGVVPILDKDDPSSRRAWLVGVPLGLLCWTRPDGPLFVAVFALVTVLAHRLRRPGWTAALRLSALPVAAVLVQLGFRLIYYGDWLPNPAYIKARVDGERAAQGFAYITGAWEWMFPALVVAGLGLVLSLIDERQRWRAVLVLACFAAWAGYVAAVGGDVFGARRHWVPLWLCLALMVSMGASWVARRERSWPVLVAALVSLGASAWVARLQRDDSDNVHAKRERFEWDGEVLARVLGEGFRAEQPLVAVTAAGTIPYFSQLPSLDMLGLNDRHIARQRPETSGQLGHDHADGGYVLDREPDLIVFHIGTRPNFTVGAQIEADPRFERDYRAIRLRGYDPHEREGRVYVRSEGRVGVRVESSASGKAGDIVVPGYMFRHKASFAQPGVEGGIDAVLPAHARLRLDVPVSAGTWRVSLSPANADVEVGILAKQKLVSSVTLAEDARVRVRVKTGDAGTVLGTIRLVRVEDGAVPDERVAPRGEPEYTAEPFGTFDDEGEGWAAEGSAFSRVKPGRISIADRRIMGNIGMFLSSYDDALGDEATGMVSSELFMASAGSVLSFRIGGGKRGVGVRLMEGTRTLIAWHGRDNEILRELRFGLTAYAGRSVHVEIFDDSPQAHVLADEFILQRPSGS